MNEEMNQNSESEQFPVQEKKSMGMIFGDIVIIIVILVAAFYVWGNRGNNVETVPTNVPVINEEIPVVPEEIEGIIVPEEDLQEDLQIEALEDQGTTDEIDEIIEDLEATSLDDLTGELDQIEVELGLE